MIHGTSAAVTDFLARGGRPVATVAVILNVTCSKNNKGHALNLVRHTRYALQGMNVPEDFPANLMNQVG